MKTLLTVTFRNLRRTPVLSVINIAGLSVGLACVMLILLFVSDEYSYDRFYENGDRIFRSAMIRTDTLGTEWKSANTGLPQGPTYATDIPEISAYTRFKGNNVVVKKGGEGLLSRTLWVEPTFFRFFPFAVIRGNARHFLDDRNSVVISDKAAAKYFGEEDAVGKSLEVKSDDKFERYTVTGVVKSPPLNSSVQFELLLPFSQVVPAEPAAYNDAMSDWRSTWLSTFFMLRPGADRAAVEKKMERSYLAHNAEGWAAAKASGGMRGFRIMLQPLPDIHLDPGFYGNGITDYSDSKYSYILSGFGLLILVIACVNFLNILLARALARSKEIGVRKVSGGSRGQLIRQFLGESGVITGVSFVPAILFTLILLPAFSRLSDKYLDAAFLWRPSSVAVFAGLWALVSILGGIYPAFIASGFKPVQTLYGRQRLKRSSVGQALVVVQFVIAITLITCTLVLQRQFRYMSTADHGFRTKNILRIDFDYGHPADMQAFKAALRSHPEIDQVGGKAGDWNKSKFTINGRQTDWTYYELIDPHYLDVLHIPIVSGRNLDPSRPADKTSYCLVNEAFARKLLDPDSSPVGQSVTWGSNGDYPGTYTVAGVVKNYHLASFREAIEPAFFAIERNDNLYSLDVAYRAGRDSQALASVLAEYKKVLPYSSPSYSFLDAWERNLYRSEANWKQITTYSALIAIVLSCMGLFALTALAVQQRVKEIGIRKVLGASAAGIHTLLSARFLKLVLIAFCISAPVAWWFMHRWLQSFAYRIDLSPWIFAVSVAFIVFISWLTISYHTVKAAVANPIKSLRTE